LAVISLTGRSEQNLHSWFFINDVRQESDHSPVGNLWSGSSYLTLWNKAVQMTINAPLFRRLIW
jgi:hypothetical protein